MMFSCFKRSFDFVLALVLLIVLSPLLIIISILVIMNSSGKVLFTQKRAGKNNQPFTIYKFRTMVMHTPDNTPTHLLFNADKYITSIGKFLRRTSLDELPQLWNILMGDMSFVGPRPVVMSEVALTAMRTQLGVSSVRPGITGLAQVRGRDTLNYKVKARYDAYYVKHACFLFDLKIVWETLRCVMTGEGIREGKSSHLA